MTLLDGHAHLWGDDIAAADWLAGNDSRALRRPFGIDELAAVAPAGTRFVCVAAESTRAETERLVALAAVNPAIAAVVGWVDPVAPTEVEGLAGVRLPLIDKGPHWLADPRVVAGIRELAGRGLVIELLVTADHLRVVGALCDTIPEATFVLDHLGAPGPGAWRTDATALAIAPNIVTKLSGAALDAEVAPVLEAFGPDRVLFGSDWPVSTLGRSYAATVERAREIVDALGWDHAGVFGDNAARTYGVAA